MIEEIRLKDGFFMKVWGVWYWNEYKKWVTD